MKEHIALLGATGTVGQKFISLLETCDDFVIDEVSGSDAHSGKFYKDAVYWRDQGLMPARIGNLTQKKIWELTSKYVISSIPAEAATEIESWLASHGHIVISNSSAMRMKADVPLIIPEVNPKHLDLCAKQKTNGKIITNPNCSTVFLALALAPLKELAEIEHVHVVTMQAISGAGYPGVPASDIVGNIIPFINGEEEKIERETKKILGTLDKPASFGLTVHVHRVPIQHGHMIATHVHFNKSVTIADVIKKFNEWNKRHPGLYALHFSDDHPRPSTDLSILDQRVHIGRLKQGHAPNVVGLVSLGHNLVRGAAGAALLNLRLAKKVLG
jgi:aspartate-semialdehyde dehydrogenase